MCDGALNERHRTCDLTGAHPPTRMLIDHLDHGVIGYSHNIIIPIEIGTQSIPRPHEMVIPPMEVEVRVLCATHVI